MDYKKGFIVPVLIAVVILVIGGVFLLKREKVEAPITVNPNSTTTQNIVGNDKDTHGCIGSAGYSWCAEKSKCLRVWEEKCEATTTDVTAGWKTYTNTQYGFQITFSEIWKGYKVVKEDNNNILFCVPSKKPLDKVVSGYSCLYRLVVSDRIVWEKEAEPCLKNSEAESMCDWVGNVVGKNEKYVFSLSNAVQDFNEEDNIAFNDFKNNIIPTFKLVR